MHTLLTVYDILLHDIYMYNSPELSFLLCVVCKSIFADAKIYTSTESILSFVNCIYINLH